MRRGVLPLLAIVGLACAMPSARASGRLDWDRTSIDVTAKPGEKVIHVDFPFRNAGDRPVTLVSVETSCRCTSAETSKRTYAPGEKDVMGVDVSLVGQDGLITKSVTVATDGPELQPVCLTVRIRIPDSAPAQGRP